MPEACRRLQEGPDRLSAGYVVRPSVADDLPEIIELMRVCLGPSLVPRTLEFWKWKHELNPFGRSPTLVAEATGRVIGFRAFLKWSWVSAGRVIHTARAVDTATHPGWQRRGVFSHLTRELIARVQNEKTPFVFNTPNRSSRSGYLKLGWKQVCRIPLWVRVLRPVRAVVRLPVAKRDSWTNDTGWVGDHTLFQQDWLRGYEEDSRLHTFRTPGYLQWRYARVPGITYHAKSVADERGSALLIYRKRHRMRLREVSVSELLFSRPAPDVSLGKELLEESAASSGADYMVAVAAEQTPEGDALRASGFRIIRHAGPVLTVRMMDDHATVDPLNWSSWRVSFGDLELF